MPNFTGVTARPRFTSAWAAFHAAMPACRASMSPRVHDPVPAPGGPLRVPHRLAVGGGLPLGVEVAPSQVGRVDPEKGGAPADDVLDDEHPLRAAEAPEGRLGGLVRPGDPAVHADVGDPVGVVDVAQGPGEDRLGEVEAPPAVGGERRVEGTEQPVGVEGGAPPGVEAVPLAGHRHVLRPAEAQPHGAAGEARAEGGDGGEPVRLHLLAPEATAHPQALDGHRVARHARGRARRCPGSRWGAACCSGRTPGPTRRRARVSSASRGRSAPGRRARARR